MKHIPSYSKILTLGAAYTEKAFNGEVSVQEKVDGSQFRFGVNEDGHVVCASKSVAFNDFRAPDGMFVTACTYIGNLDLSWLPNDSYFYGEYLQSPKHNTLKYGRVPQNNIVVFDALIGGKFITDREELKKYTDRLGVDLIPELYKGEMTTEKIKDLMTTESYLGEVPIEGLVIKNYNETFTLGGNVFPLFTKYVSEEFKEKHKLNPEYTSKTDKVTAWTLRYLSEARWEKAYQYLRDRGELEINPRDIPKLFKRVHEDIEEEEKENIKNELYDMFIKDLLKVAGRGLPEWYKNKLLERVGEGE